MSRTSVAVGTAAVALAGAGAAVLGGRALLHRQAAIARRRIGKPLGEQAPDADRVWRRGHDGEPIELLLVGDSIAAGLGAERRKDTLGGHLSKGLARRTHRPVRLRTAAVVGSESAALGAQLDGLPPEYRPDVAVIVVGGNDITHRIPVAVSVRHLERAIARLQVRGAAVVVGTCPDLGALRPVPQPLRSLGARLSRQLAAAQADAARRAGARAVDLRRAVGAVFISQPEEMFSLDRFHPSALGYRRTADALLPEVAAALHASARQASARRAAAASAPLTVGEPVSAR
jgi:lysophospholipase L1-like esterase